MRREATELSHCGLENTDFAQYCFPPTPPRLGLVQGLAPVQLVWPLAFNPLCPTKLLDSVYSRFWSRGWEDNYQTCDTKSGEVLLKKKLRKRQRGLLLYVT